MYEEVWIADVAEIHIAHASNCNMGRVANGSIRLSSHLRPSGGLVWTDYTEQGGDPCFNDWMDEHVEYSCTTSAAEDTFHLLLGYRVDRQGTMSQAMVSLQGLIVQRVEGERYRRVGAFLHDWSLKKIEQTGKPPLFADFDIRNFSRQEITLI
tara:strand:- start:2881 stop:3339 length:459 start_codon:yes stop_codon:yes gene_type:complete